MIKRLILACIILVLSLGIHAQYSIPSKMNWWYESRFGMFIHFGSYSYYGHGEWAFSSEKFTKTKYQAEVSVKFNPQKFNAGTIARLAKNAGMKYIVITAKHHEGFCMWDTKVESFKDVTGTKPYDLPGFTKFGNRDILKELKDSCDSVGIKFCLYYSILDWNHLSQNINDNLFSTMVSDSARTSYIKDMKAQLKELINRYHPAVMWFDGDWLKYSGTPTLPLWWTKSDGTDLYNYLIGLDSSLIVNERVCREFGIGDFECPEQKIPGAALTRPWETNQTMNNSWGYAFWDNSYKSPKTLVGQLVDVVSKDGNFLLNIGPKGDGTLTDQTAPILTSIGKWMDINHESIYGTIRSPYKKAPDWGKFTRKDGKLFIHVFSWPESGSLKIRSLTSIINKIYLLSDTAKQLSFKDSIGYTTITIPANAPDTINSVIVVDVDGLPEASTEYIKTTGITVKGQDGVKTITSAAGSLQLTITVSPNNATDKSVSWSVSDSSIATISQGGLLTAKANGLDTVFATANDGSEVKGKIVVSISGQNTRVQAAANSKLIRISPNPFNSFFRLTVEKPSDVSEISLYTINGLQVGRFNHSNVEKEMILGAKLKPDTYIVKIAGSFGNQSFKLIKL